MKRIPVALLVLIGVLAVGYFAFRRSSGETPVQSPASGQERELRIITLLPRDAIPAIDNPRFYPSEQADAEYAPEETVLGVSHNGESRAYSVALLSRHEIVNDTVGGRKIAVTW